MSDNGRVDVGSMTHPGRERGYNQDSLAVPPRDLNPKALAAKGQLFVVADGMGGHEGGERASALAAGIIMREYYREQPLDPKLSLEQAIRLANAQIYAEAQQSRAEKKMGTTVTAAVIRGNDLWIANVGDSRTYLLRGGVPRQLTLDHSLVAEGVRNGTVRPEQAASHPYRGVVTRALGNEPQVEIDFFHFSLQPGDSVLLCSDGLTNEVDDRTIADIIARGKSAQEATAQLVEQANRNGGRDNITAVVVHVNGRRPAAAPALARGRRVPSWLYVAAASTVAVALVLALIVALAGGGQPTPTAVALAATEVATTEGTATPSDAVPTTAGTADGVAGSGSATAPAGEQAPPEPTTTDGAPDVIPTSTVEPSDTPALTATKEPRATPKPTQTSRPPTPTHQAYPRPVPEAPANGIEIVGQETVELRWRWEGNLRPNEHFDVRVWREGQSHLGVAWADEPSYRLHIPSLLDVLREPDMAGTYYWAIAVVRGSGGVVDHTLSDESEAWSFTWTAPPPPTDRPSKPTPDPCAGIDCEENCYRGKCHPLCDQCCGGCK